MENNNKKTLVILTSVILVITRVWLVIMVSFYYNTPFWQGIKNDNFEHYQLATGLFLFCLVFGEKLKKHLLLYIIILSFGSALLIDELGALTAMFWRVPFHFLGWIDWFTTFVGFLAFLAILYSKNRWTWIAVFVSIVSVIQILF